MVLTNKNKYWRFARFPPSTEMDFDILPPQLQRQTAGLINAIGDDFSWDPMENNTENLAMVFTHFKACLTPFDGISDIMAQFGPLSLLESITLSPENMPCDRYDVFVGETNDFTLSNVKRFYAFNDVHTDRTWCYDVVVVVGYNNLSGIIVDVPPSAFPWCVNPFGESHIGMPMPNFMVSNHMFRQSCSLCYSPRKCSCAIPRADTCGKCPPGKCIPRAGAELENLRTRMGERLAQDISVLCPPFQHVILSVSTVVRASRLFPGVNRPLLKKIVESETVMSGRDFVVEANFKQRFPEFQMVRISDGRLSIMEQSLGGQRIGLSVPRKTEKGKPAIGKIISTFGASDPWDIISLFNAAFDRPGQLFVRDLVLWDSKLSPIVCRLVMMIETISVDESIILVGWA